MAASPPLTYVLRAVIIRQVCAAGIRRRIEVIMKQNNAFVAIGLMLFALFFGAGNIIFPPFLGQHAGTNTLPAIIGFLITGCGLPLLGVVTVGWSGKNLQDIAGRVAPWYGVFMVAAISLTIGPCFAIPRTCSTSYEMSIVPLLGQLGQTGLFVYSLLFFALTWWLAVTPTKLVDRVGKFLTPIMLVLLFALFAAFTVDPFGAWQAPADSRYMDGLSAFTAGIMEGYNTMDGLAGLLFGILVVEAVRLTGRTDPHAIARDTLRSGVVAMFFMCIIYVFLGFIGASSVGPIGMQENGAPILVGSMNWYFGAAGPAILSVIVLLACLTTSIGLVASVAALFHALVPKVSAYAFATIFSVVSCGIANFGLTTIISAAVPVLVFLYPLTIALIILTFLNDTFRGSPVVHRTATLFTFFPAFYDGLHALGAAPDALTAFMQSLPLASYGLAWLPIFAAGLLIGWGLYAAGGRKPSAEYLESRK